MKRFELADDTASSIAPGRDRPARNRCGVAAFSLLSLLLIAGAILLLGSSGRLRLGKVSTASHREHIFLAATSIIPLHGRRVAEEVKAAASELLRPVEGKRKKLVIIGTAMVYSADRSEDFLISAWDDKVRDGVLQDRRAALPGLAKIFEEEYSVDASIYDVSESGFDDTAFEKGLQTADALYVMGGNTFALNFWMRRRGRTDIIKKRNQEGALVYMGNSAGAIIAGDSIKPALWKQVDAQDTWKSDEVRKPAHSRLAAEWAREPWNSEEDWKALELVPGLTLCPHYVPSNWEIAVKWLGDKNTIALANGHALLYSPATQGAGGLPTRISPAGTSWGEPWAA